MTQQAYSRQELAYEAEGSWAEAVDTHAARLQVLGPIDPSGLVQNFIEMNPVTSRMGEGIVHRRGGKGGQIQFTLEGGGHGGSAAVGLTATDLYTLLVYAFSRGSFATIGSTAVAGGTASVFDTAGGTIVPGALVRVGTNDPKDSRGNGQIGVCNTFAGNTLTLRNALDAAPALNDVVYAMLTIFCDTEDIALTSLRFAFASANQRYYLKGCVITDVQLTFGVGEVPMWTFTVAVSDWAAEVTTTFPTVDTTDAKVGAPASGGSLFIGDYDSVTRSLYDAVNMELELQWNVPLIHLPGGNDRVTLQDAKRMPPKPYFSCLVPEGTASANPEWYAWADTDEASIKPQRIVCTINGVDGRCMGFHLPKCIPARDWSRPTFVEFENMNYVPLRFEALTGDVVTSDLTLSPIVFGIG